jgi:ribonuclease P protein component
MKPLGLPRTLRLKRRREFLRVQKGGRKQHTRHFLVFVRRRSDEDPTRLGITVTRKVANAVGRNRIKRLVRESFRRARPTMPVGFDLVWVAKRDTARVGYREVAQEMALVAESLGRAGGGRDRRR